MRLPRLTGLVGFTTATMIVAAAILCGSAVQAQKAPATKPSPEPSPKQSIVTAGDKIFDFTRVHRIRLSITPSEWAVLQTSGGRSTAGPGGSDYRTGDGRLVHLSSGFANTLPWAHADLRIDDAADADGKAEFKDIGIRYKGNSSFTRSSIAAPLLANFKLKIDLHGTKGTWDGEKSFNLQSGVVDVSRMKDHIAYWIYRRAGVPAPRTTYAEVVFNVPGVYQETSAGMFTIVEDVNGKFLERVLPPGTGLLMKPEQLGGGIHWLGETWAQYAPKLRPDRDATPHEQQRVMEFSALCSQSDVALFRAKVATYLDVDEFLRFIAVNAFTANWDSYLGGGHNFYLYLDPKDDKFRFIPWDQDLSLQPRGGVPGADILNPAGPAQVLIYWLLDDPAVATQYRAILKELSTTAFSPVELSKLLDTLESALSAEAQRAKVERLGTTGSPRDFVMGRANMVQQLVASWTK